MSDPIEVIARQRLIEMAIDVQVQLERGSGTRPVLWLLARARARATTAIYAMVKVDPTNVLEITRMQNEVNLYGDLVDDCRALLARGKEEDRELDEQDRIEIADLLSPEDAQKAGLTQTPEDT